MLFPISSARPLTTNVIRLSDYRLNSPARVRAAQPETPVTPVRPSPAVYGDASRRVNLSASLWTNAYHAEQANRARLQDGSLTSPGVYTELPGQSAASSPALGLTLPEAYPAELAARMRTSYPEDQAQVMEPAGLGAEKVQETAEEGRCETCEKRKYQDGSDDISVSYQSPTEIDPDAAAAAVRGHEMEHVYHEQAKAQREGRKVVSQTVTLHTDICPECGRAYVSGGTTRTVTKEKAEIQPEGEQGESET